MAPEAISPKCAECSAWRPANCAYVDWSSEHSYPCGGAIFLLKLELAQLLLKKEGKEWNQELLEDAAMRGLESEGYTSGGIARIFSERDVADWRLQRGIEQIIKELKIKFTSSDDAYFFDYVSYGEQNPWDGFRIVYFRTHLPGGKFTHLPILFSKGEWESGWEQFLEPSFDRKRNIVGDSEEWEENWNRFWQERGVINHGFFVREQNLWWKGISEGNLSLCGQAVNLVAAKRRLLDMLVDLKSNYSYRLERQ